MIAVVFFYYSTCGHGSVFFFLLQCGHGSVFSLQCGHGSVDLVVHHDCDTVNNNMAMVFDLWYDYNVGFVGTLEN